MIEILTGGKSYSGTPDAASIKFMRENWGLIIQSITENFIETKNKKDAIRKKQLYNAGYRPRDEN